MSLIGCVNNPENLSETRKNKQLKSSGLVDGVKSWKGHIQKELLQQKQDLMQSIRDFCVDLARKCDDKELVLIIVQMYIGCSGRYYNHNLNEKQLKKLWRKIIVTRLRKKLFGKTSYIEQDQDESQQEKDKSKQKNKTHKLYTRLIRILQKLKEKRRRG